MPEISTDLEPHTIIEFHIYGFILPILKAILGKNMAKTLQKFYQYEKSVQTDVFKNFKLKQSDSFSDSVSSSSSVPSYQSRIDCGTKLSSISPPVFHLSKLQFEGKFLWLSRRANFANGAAFGENC